MMRATAVAFVLLLSPTVVALYAQAFVLPSAMMEEPRAALRRRTTVLHVGASLDDNDDDDWKETIASLIERNVRRHEQDDEKTLSTTEPEPFPGFGSPDIDGSVLGAFATTALFSCLLVKASTTVILGAAALAAAFVIKEGFETFVVNDSPPSVTTNGDDANNNKPMSSSAPPAVVQESLAQTTMAAAKMDATTSTTAVGDVDMRQVEEQVLSSSTLSSSPNTHTSHVETAMEMPSSVLQEEQPSSFTSHVETAMEMPSSVLQEEQPSSLTSHVETAMEMPSSVLQEEQPSSLATSYVETPMEISSSSDSPVKQASETSKSIGMGSASYLDHLSSVSLSTPEWPKAAPTTIASTSGNALSNAGGASPGGPPSFAAATSEEVTPITETPQSLVERPATGTPLEIDLPGIMRTKPSVDGSAKQPTYASTTTSALYSSVSAQVDAAPIPLSTKIERIRVELDLAKQWQQEVLRKQHQGFNPVTPPAVNGRHDARPASSSTNATPSARAGDPPTPEFPKPPQIVKLEFPAGDKNGRSAPPSGQKVARLKNELDLARKFFDDI